MNPTFNLPDKKAHTGAVVGNGITLGLTDGSAKYGLSFASGGYGSYNTTNTNAYGKSLPSTYSGGTYPVNAKNLGIDTDGTKSGLIVEADADLVVCIKY